MSAETIRIGKASTVTETDVAVAIADGPFLAANANRICLWLAPPFVNNVTLSFDGVAVLGQGINLPALGGMVRLSIDDYGPLITGAIRAIASVATTITVFEQSSTAG